MNRRAHIFLGLGWLLMVGVGGRFLLWPAVEHARDLDADIAAKQATIARQTTGPEVIEKIARELTALRALSDSRMTPIAEEAGVAGMVSGLSDSLDALGLTDRELNTGSQRQLDEASVLPMSIVIRGDFPSIVRAVEQTESLPRLVRVQRLRIAQDSRPNQAGGPVDRSGKVKAEISLDVFFAPKTVTAQGSNKAEVTP